MLLTVVIATYYFTTSTFGEVIFNHNTGDDPLVCTENATCIKKCCPEDQIFEDGECKFSPTHKFEFQVYHSTDESSDTVSFTVIHDMSCPEDDLELNLLEEEDLFYVQQNGTLLISSDNGTSIVPYTNYCLDTFVTPDGEKITAAVCEKLPTTEPPSPSFDLSTLTYGDVILNHNTGDNHKWCTRRVPCIKKCCPEHYAVSKGTCAYSPTNNLDFKAITDGYNHTVKFNVIHNRNCSKQNLKLAKEEKSDEYYIHENGTLLKPYDDSMPTVPYHRYCIDNFITPRGEEFGVLVCYGQGDLEKEEGRETDVMGMIISMPFLLITFLVYLILPERNLHRKALMSYVFALLAAYISLVTIQLYPGKFPDIPCHIFGYLIIFFFLVSFFWMNVMCVDMWLAFSGMRTVLSKKTAERKRFIIYCIYAWGMPIIHIIIVLLMNTYSSKDAKYWPQIGDKRCFLGDGMPTFYYFYLPMAILIGINIILFILTTVRIQRIKKETSMLKQTESKKSYEDDKQKFNLYLKLMFAMGINWIMELVSWSVDQLATNTPPFIWYLTDFTNAMYGVLIFIIFVFKKKIWQTLKKRYYIFIGKPHLAHTLTTSSSARGTRTSNYSTTDTAVSTDYRLSDMKKNPEESALNRT